MWSHQTRNQPVGLFFLPFQVSQANSGSKHGLNSRRICQAGYISFLGRLLHHSFTGKKANVTQNQTLSQTVVNLICVSEAWFRLNSLLSLSFSLFFFSFLMWIPTLLGGKPSRTSVYYFLIMWSRLNWSAATEAVVSARRTRPGPARNGGSFVWKAPRRLDSCKKQVL